MNEVILRMHDHKKRPYVESEYLHLLTILEQISQSKYLAADTASAVGKMNIKLAESGKRMRKVVRRANFRMTGKHPSLKNGRMMHWESGYEKAVFQMLEISPLVKSYCEQPAELNYCGEDGEMHLHYPDILVELTCGIKLFIEVKPADAATDDSLANRTALVKSLLRPMGYLYLVILPEQIDRHAYLDNAKQLLLHSKAPMPETVWEKVRRIFLHINNIELSELTNLIGHEYAKSWVYRLMISGVLCCDLALPIGEKTKINWKQKGAI